MRQIPLAAMSLLLMWSAFGALERAEAQIPVAVLPFEGAGGGARRQVARALESDGRVTVIEESLTDAAVARASEPARVARELGARLVIGGRVTGRGRRQRFQLRAHDATGREVASTGGATRRQGIARAARAILDEALPELPPPSTASSATSTSTSQSTTVPASVHASTSEPMESPPDPDRDAPSDAGSEGTPSEWDMRAPLLELQVGVVPRSRDADVTFQSSRSGRYSAWYSELAVRAELRPFNSDRSILRGLYARGFFAHAVALSSRVEACDPETSGNCSVDTSFWRLDFGAGLLFPLADILDLGIEFGAGWDTYGLSDNPLLESAQYVYLRPALRARMRLYREYLVVGAEMGARPVLHRGRFAQYGQDGDSIGFDIGGTLGGGVALAGNIGMTYGVSFAYVNYWHNFSNAADTTLAATSGTDGGIRIEVLLGFALW